MEAKMLFLALGLAYLLGAVTGPLWTSAWTYLTHRFTRSGFEHYFPDDHKRRRRRRRTRDHAKTDTQSPKPNH